MRVKFRHIFLPLLGFAIISADLTVSATVVEQTFKARVKMALCPEYKLGGVQIRIQYRIGNTGVTKTASVFAQSINTSANTGRFDILLPTGYGTTPLQIFAQCINTRGSSAPSNVKSISNCNALSVLDTDGDGIRNNVEDRNCSNGFDTADLSNPDHFDSDGDGIRDYTETLSGTNPIHAGSSPRPFIFSGAPFDPDGDGTSNPVVWRVSQGRWYIKDFGSVNNHLSFPWGVPGDVPIVYDPQGANSNVGVVRRLNGYSVWYLRGLGFKKSDGKRVTSFPFGLANDTLILGPWERRGVTNPAVARLSNNAWHFYIYLSNGTYRHVVWGINNDVPKVQDYDGDGLFDIAVYRSSTRKFYIILSSNNQVKEYSFGKPTSDYTFRGDITGDGVDDITFWEPSNGLFTSMLSDQGFNQVQTDLKNSLFYNKFSLGKYNVHLPLSWNYRNGKVLYTVIDHQRGMRYYKDDNNGNNVKHGVQWGLPGDAQG